ncbi:Phage capsid family protein [compost metagenome]
MPTKMERAEIATIATWIPASLQVLQDNDQLEGQINTLMSVGVRQKLEAELINGDGGAGEKSSGSRSKQPLLASPLVSRLIVSVLPSLTSRPKAGTQT